MKDLRRITINCRKGTVFIIDYSDILEKNFDYNLKSVINGITFILEDSKQYRKELLLKLIEMLHESNRIMYIGKRNITLDNDIAYKNVKDTDINSLKDVVNTNNVDVLIINDFQYLLNSNSETVFSLLKELKEEGLAIVVALKMRDVDEIIFPIIESIGSIILVAEK